MEPIFLNQFPPVDKAAWRAQVQKDLKDTAAPDSLRWEIESTASGEKIILDPYYTIEDLTDLPMTSLQAAQKSHPGWLNVSEVIVGDEKETNTHLLNLLTRGADGFILDLTKRDVKSIQWSRLLHPIKLSDTPIWFRVNGQPDEMASALVKLMPYQLKGGILNHSAYSTTGTEKAASEQAEATRLTQSSPQFRTIQGSSTVFHHAGATATQELAFLFGSLADQYDALTAAGLTLEQLVPKTIVSIPVGTSYFVEIAKLRAFRVLWRRFLTAYPISETLATTSAFVLAQTSTFYDAIQSPYTNLLRATTEAMAAVIGGCDILTVHPYNAIIDQPTNDSDREHADRIARNVSVLLKEESYLDKVVDPSAGSYYIETLTHELVEAAWALFLQVEKMGGLQKAIETGFVQAELDKAYQTKIDALKNGRVMVGVTKFQEPREVPTNAEMKASDSSTELAFALGPVRRLAEEFEH